jgi:hypothetical protein
VREYCTPGSVRGASGNWRPYRDGSHDASVATQDEIGEIERI